ncbi:MAG TPA: Fur family transcriptional regulator [Azoarcus taiwanensis]|uniref:Ferric uptake regulation protein n=1 Tax=Azoarcus taiwanensis TaxID=666964 RepID=A0A972J9J9_9RHOO|nr:Fur family transcriptional regulator [Azoarcus taiwanensis]NMG04944.1 transcriptional repressor [Azoarcus taiwanensis]HRQ56195.1 Fur family transcriptional regulator [Azoarcus taiwanensis]
MVTTRFPGAAERLRKAGIPPTRQRVAIAEVLFARPVHLSADQVLARVREHMPEMSRATVYNTLKLFREKNMVRELVVDPERVFYDSNTAPHYHLFDVRTGELSDVSADELQVIGTPVLPAGLELEEVDVIIRVRSRAPA